MLYKIIRGIIRPIVFLLYRPKVEGLENFPESGKTIVYSNHISVLDPVIIGCILPRKIHFMAKIELFKNPLFSFILKKLGAFPVKRGTADISAIKNSLQVLREGKVFGIFPEGTRNRQGGVHHFSHGIASIAHRSKAKIIPIAIKGQYKLFRPINIRIGEALNVDNYFSQKSSTELLDSMARDMENSLKNLMEN